MKRNLLRLFSLGIVCCLASCSSPSDKAQQDGQPAAPAVDAAAPKAAAQAFGLITAEPEWLNGAPFAGKLYKQLAWTDANGNNLLLFSMVDSAHMFVSAPEVFSRELHAYHYLVNDGGFELVREVKDFVNDCGFNLSAGFLDQSIGITDADANGYGEAVFAYYLQCASELSPYQLKLMVLENGKKYAIRGASAVADPAFNIKAETKPDYEGAPQELKKLADSTWKAAQERLLQPIDAPAFEGKMTIEQNCMNMSFRGNEPSWTLNFGADLCYFNRMGAMEMEIPVQQVTATGGGWTVTASVADTKLTINIKEEVGYDDMSGQAHPYKVTVLQQTAGDPDVTFYGVGGYMGYGPFDAHPDGTAALPIHKVTLEQVFKAFDEFRFAVMTQNAERLAKVVAFPLRINTGPGQSLSLANATELQNQFQAIFSDQLRTKTFNIKYETISETSQGISPADGLVWFTVQDGQVKLLAINDKK